MRYTLGGRGFHEKEICLMDAVFLHAVLSAFTFGGGYVIVSLMKKKFVDEYHWIEEDEMLDLIGHCAVRAGSDCRERCDRRRV